MAYFPKSQIKTGLYSSGEYFFLNTNESYIGPYYEISNGKKYTGKSPDDNSLPQYEIILNPNTELIDGVLTYVDSYGTPSPNKIVTSFLSGSYESLAKSNSPSFPPKERFLPTPSITLPTEQDYKNRRMIRYFAKKTNELKYLETSKQTFTDLNSGSPDIARDLYDPLQIQWIISGFSKQQINNYNKIIVRDIEQKRRWYGFSQFLKEDYTKYYKNLSS